MTAASLAATAAVLSVFHCSAAPEVGSTLAPTPAGEYVTLVNYNATAFDFDLGIKGGELSITALDDHAVFAKGSHRFSRVVDGPSAVYSSLGDPCVVGQQPCASTANVAKNPDGSLTFIFETMWAVKIKPTPPGPILVRPGMVIIHGGCKSSEGKP